MLHKILSDRRREIGMSIDQLVKKSGISKSTLTKVLTGVSPNPALETVKAIAYALGLSLNDLDENKPLAVSEKAMEVAYAYDSMSRYGRSIIDCVVQNETMFSMAIQKVDRLNLEHINLINSYMMRDSVPVFEMPHDTIPYMKYHARKEREEMEIAEAASEEITEQHFPE